MHVLCRSDLGASLRAHGRRRAVFVAVLTKSVKKSCGFQCTAALGISARGSASAGSSTVTTRPGPLSPSVSRP